MQNDAGGDNEDSNVYRFISDLRQEALFISSERDNLKSLNETIRNKTGKLLQTTWVTTKKRLLLLPQREFNANSFEGIASLGVTEFVEAKTAIGFQNAGKLGTFLQVLRTQPEQLAQWLIIAEQLNDEHALCLSVMQSIVSGLYGSFIFSEDINYMLLLLHELAKAQVCGAEKPQRILKHRTNSFSILYFMFHEVLLSAKYFLSAALEVPILRLLTIDYYVDVDPDKTVMRYQQEVNIRALFKDVDEYRNDVVQRLVELTDLFITAIQDNSLIFPKPLSWLICRIFERISDVKEANAVITELIFTQFICPAIVNPEQYGICDAQITTVSRHNLMQVGQTIQKLALIKYESPDITSLDLFSDLIKENKVTSFLEQLLSEMKPCPSPPVDNTPFVFRNAALYTEQELNFMLTFLHKVHEEIVQNEIYQKQCSSPDSIVTQLSALNISSIENSPKPTRRSNNSNRDSTLKRANIILFGSKNQETKSTGEIKAVANAVLIIYIGTDNIEPKGLMSEQQVIMRNFANSELVYPKADTKLGAEIEKNGEMHEVKVSFPNYPDEGSIGNTSDNLEAISEGASNHSVASSLEMENEDQNDNYSDMVSANVSGRGTPNISGRDTPSSQVIENEDRALPEARPADNIARPQPQLSRQIRSEIDDKFCKFEIKLAGPGGDETTSLISETWSTDVLASDNEAVDATDMRVERQCFSLIDQAIAETPVGNLLDLSETQSESAWSTDVMTSDTERLTEIDNDDTGSIAQSDDTNSVAPSDDTRSETDENATTPGSRRLSSSSFPFTSHIPAVNFSNLPSANYQDFRKVDIKSDQGTYTKIQARSNRKDSNANVIFKPFANREQTISTFSEQHTEKNSNNSNVIYSEHSTEIQTLTFNSINISNTFASTNNQKSLFKINEIKEVPGPSGLHQRHSVEEDSTDPSLAYLKENRTKYMDGSMDILLSNCSLNSSSSGSSSNSFENKSSNHETSEKWENKQWLNSSQNSLNVTSTPSESTSEMSVLSVTNIINPLNMNKKSTNLTTRNMKPPASTGAIPKSISFDVTADKGDKYLDDDQRSKRGGFFGKLKMGFRKRGKFIRNQEDFRLDSEEYLNSNSNMKKLLDSPEKLNNNLDLSDDILAKYRTKPFVESSPIKISNDSSKLSRIRHISESTVTSNEGGNTFKDIKSKLRKVLSSTKAQLPGFIKIRGISTKNKIETVLRLELGMARKLRKWSYMARISETIKCMNLLDDEKSNVKLVQSMKEDILQRSVYTQYLTCARRDLMLSESYLDGLSEQVLHEKIQCEEYLAMIYVNDFLQNKESDIEIFCVEFKQLWVSDEKYDLLKNFCLRLYAEIKKDLIWKDVFKDKKETIKKTMERSVISKVYENALYPNGDGDRDRDRVLFEHIQKLSNIITPDHKYLMIQKLFLRECPWQPAQDALNAMSAYRTPRDKLNCVLQCAKCIMDLLSMAQASSTAADDFTPVLVFVIIKSNPSFLLSTIQFVNSFFHNDIFGEEQYYWTQFCSAVEFIKTMDYSD